MTEQISLLTAVRCGEVHPPMLARAIATLDHMLAGRLTLNIISKNVQISENCAKILPLYIKELITKETPKENLSGIITFLNSLLGDPIPRLVVCAR